MKLLGKLTSRASAAFSRVFSRGRSNPWKKTKQFFGAAGRWVKKNPGQAVGIATGISGTIIGAANLYRNGRLMNRIALLESYAMVTGDDSVRIDAAGNVRGPGPTALNDASESLCREIRRLTHCQMSLNHVSNASLRSEDQVQIAVVAGELLNYLRMCNPAIGELMTHTLPYTQAFYNLGVRPEEKMGSGLIVRYLINDFEDGASVGDVKLQTINVLDFIMSGAPFSVNG
jgi:hypothetical protein